jgi:alcohol dehydrogenase class IV
MMILNNLNFSAWMPTQVVFGLNSVREKLPVEVLNAGCKKPLIVTDQGLVNSGMIDVIVESLSKHNIDPVVFAEVEPNPVASTVHKGGKLFSEEQCDLIIAVGGGSSMDAAKAIAVTINNPGDILDYRRGGKLVQEPLPPIYAIPTTAGTGSEVTAVAVITDPVRKRKFVVASPLVAPKIAFVDPAMTYTLPRHHIAATGMDALVHAIEAYTANRAHPVSDALALEAIRMIREYLPASYSDPTNHEAKAQVLLASTIAGFAIALSGCALVHSMSHAMTAWFHVPHGLANAILLPYVTEFNLIANYEKYANIQLIFDKSSYSLTKYAAAEKLVEELRKFSHSLDIPDDFGYLTANIDDEVISGLADDVLDDRGTFPYNPRKATKEDVINLYKKVFPQYQSADSNSSKPALVSN